MKRARCIAKVDVVRFNARLAAGVAHLWRRCFPCRELHAHIAWNPSGGPITRRSLEQRVLSCDDFDPAGSFVALERRRVVGFCLAAMRRGRRARAGYLSALMVAPRLRRQGIGSMLLGRAERYLARRGAQKILTSYDGNPMPLLLGVPPGGEAYAFLLSRGYRSYDRRFLQVMAQDTARFRLRRPVRERIRRLEAKGFRLRRMEARDRRPLDRLLAKHFPAWRKAVMTKMKPDAPRGLLVAVRGRALLGFAGPFSVGSRGSGHFSALGLAPAARGQGLGAALLHRMCAELKTAGARAIHLTT